MPVFSGTPVPIGRLLGQVDQDDPTNLPVGCAAVCLNTDFTRDSPGVTSAGTRAGNNMIMKGAASPGTGLWDYQHEPISDTDPFFQMPLRFTLSGVLEEEYPVGTGHLRPIPAGLFSLPQNSHQLSTQAGNKVWSAYSNLFTPTAGLSCFNPKTRNLDPFGMKPYGWRWLPNTLVYKGEVATPSNSFAGPKGNGHTYQAQNTGTTGANEPAWPAAESGTVVDGGVTWKELTMVMANRLPAPDAPALQLAAGGAFPGGQTVSIYLTFTNGMGETVAGAVASIATTAAGQAVKVTIPALAGLAGWLGQLEAPYAITGVNIYEADVTTGNPAPAATSFQKAGGPYALGSTQLVTGTAASGVYAPTINSARITPGQLPTPTVEPVCDRSPGSGAFAAGRDVYVAIAYANANGSTPIGPANSIINTLANDAVQVTLSQPDEYPQLSQIQVYEADVPTGSAPPPKAVFRLVGSYAPTATVTITTAATGASPVTTNGTGPGGDIQADSESGGINNTQGYRYAVPCWINRNESFSGFTEAAVSKYIVDEDGWELAVFNVPVGPDNIVGRAINFTVADGTQAGGFWWIGLVNLDVPTQNQVYPNSFQSDGITIIPTVFLDNVTTSGTFNFTDAYLRSSNNTTDRLRVGAPPIGTRVDYLTSCDRLAVCGVAGWQSGVVISLGADYESFYGDTSPLPIPSLKGERAWGCVEFRNQIYVMREQSAFVITPGTGDPASWNAEPRWGPTADAEGMGPCGPRAFAACGKFIIFVDRKGVYKYDGTGAPDLMTKEIPRMWGWINWAAKLTISVAIDEDTHTVRIQVPVGGSAIPNMEFCLSYLEGWLNPIHFSTYGQKEVTLEACRRWSFNNVSAFLCKRILRTVPNPPPLPLAPDGTTQTTSDFYLSQLAYTSTASDGLVNARTPGRYDDNGSGIDWWYQTVSAKAMQKPSKPEGVVTSARGYGSIQVGFIPGRKRIDGPDARRNILWCLQPIDLSPDSSVDFTRKPPRAMNEYWSVVYTNGKQAGSWASIKNLTAYVIPVKVARGSLDTGR